MSLMIVGWAQRESPSPPRHSLGSVTLIHPDTKLVVTYRAEGREPGNPDGKPTLVSAVVDQFAARGGAALRPFGFGVKAFLRSLRAEAAMPSRASGPLAGFDELYPAAVDAADLVGSGDPVDYLAAYAPTDPDELRWYQSHLGDWPGAYLDSKKDAEMAFYLARKFGLITI